ncbi:MAG TPA: TIM barrel protein [Symbiobacteriaceae bacterium]|nr:TIM barrel protein [Symbiobacteriaceae bacterium]
MERWKTSVGIWAFGATATRFVPGGYHPEAMAATTVEKVKTAVEGLGPLVDGYEFHYETEITDQNVHLIQGALGPDHDIYTVCYGLVPNPRFKFGSLTNPNADLRREAVDHIRRAIDLAAAVGARFIYWPGNEGYNYPFQRDYARTWGWFLEGIQAGVEHANSRNVTFLLEHKNSEPAMQILMRNIGTTLFIVKKIKEMGTDTRNLKVNMDWQHLIMNNEPLGECAALLLAEGVLAHQHANSGWGSFDDDNMVGTQFIEQQIDIIRELHRGGYRDRIGFDLFPYTEDAVEAVKRSVIQFEYLRDVALRIDDEELEAAKARADAVGAYRAVWKALGLTPAFEKQVYERYNRR